jgi:hypothetical protein
MAILVQSISSNAAKFIQLCTKATAEMHTARTVDDVVQQHIALKKEYASFINKYDELWSQIASKDDESCFEVSEIQTQVERSWHVLENELLTRFPQAQIDYGAHLVGSVNSSASLPIHTSLKSQFPYYRTIRGDGNWFYTSFAISYLQWLCQNPKRFDNALKHVFDLPDFSAKEEVVRLLMNLQEAPSSIESCIHSDTNLLVMISFLRQCAAYHLTHVYRGWQDGYLAESEKDPQTADEFVPNHVLRMGCEALSYEINAISSFLNCQIWIIDHHNGLRKFNEENAPLVSAVYRSAEEHYSSMQQSSPDQSRVSQVTKSIVKYAIPIIAGVLPIAFAYMSFHKYT